MSLTPSTAIRMRSSSVGADPSRPRIEIWCDSFPVLSQTFVVNEARELARSGVAIGVVATVRPTDPAPSAGGVPVVYIADDSRPRRAAALLSLVARHPIGCALDLLHRRRWKQEEHPVPLRRLAPAVERLRRSPATRIHVHFAGEAALSAMRASRILGRRWSLTAHAYDIYLTPRNLREKLRAATVVTSGCDYTVRDLREIAGSGHAERVHRVVMGVDPDQFSRSTPHTELRHVVAVGRLVEKKGFIHLIRAAAEPTLASVLDRLTIIGAGPLRDELGAEIRRLGLEQTVSLVGPLDPEAVRATLENAAVLAMSCVIATNGDRDSMPVVVKEALAMEVPAVVSNEVGLPELARPGFSRLVPPGDHVALATALAEVLSMSPEQRAEMGQEGRRFVEEEANLRLETARIKQLLTQLH